MLDWLLSGVSHNPGLTVGVVAAASLPAFLYGRRYGAKPILFLLAAVFTGSLAWALLSSAVVIAFILAAPHLRGPEFINIGIIQIPGSLILGSVAGLVAGLCVQHGDRERRTRWRVAGTLVLALPLILMTGICLWLVASIHRPPG